MGLIYTDLEIRNGGQAWAARQGLFKEEEVKKVRVKALVDSGAYQMSIPKHIGNQLDLQIIEKREVEYANGELEIVHVAGPVEILFMNRRTVANIFILGNEVLLGSIPMEDMDVVINPKTQTLKVNPENPNYPKMKMKIFHLEKIDYFQG